MPTKGVKPKGKARSAGGKKGKRGKRGKKKEKSSKSKIEVDMLSPAAMFNLYYISHDVAACLAFRGFQWPGKAKKKGKK
ncbi:small lysine-rich protein 1 [Heptranchias perlo]|uniref:small lysine-rich protein 1 n=1 Tax=Heptranchias perlo TaxID=212740 RepID=UPI003559DB82